MWEDVCVFHEKSGNIHGMIKLGEDSVNILVRSFSLRALFYGHKLIFYPAGKHPSTSAGHSQKHKIFTSTNTTFSYIKY
jgi:hypothetical protein